jgi:D-glycero-alpha-D-manno-heptose 1-phosphate guanylyltransferase
MQAIILAGGLGTRLKSVVKDKPKVLSLVAGKPFLQYVIDYLKKQGVTSFVFSLGYLSEQIIEFLQSTYTDLNCQFYVELSPLGPGGAIQKAIEMTTESQVLITNADTFFDIDIPSMYAQHSTSKSSCTIALKEMHGFDRYGSVEIDENNRIISFKEKSFQKSGLINGGYVFLDKKVFLDTALALPEVFSFEKDFLEVNLTKMLVKGCVFEGYFIDIGIPADYAKAQIDFAKKDFSTHL